MKQSISGASDSTRDPGQSTWKNPSFRARVAGFAIAVAAVAFLIVRIDVDIWRAQERLQQGILAIKAEKFYFGVNFRVRLRKLSDHLLDYWLAGNSADLESFHQEAREIGTWLQTKEPNFATPTERSEFRKVENAYRDFVARVDPQSAPGSIAPLGRENFSAVYERLNREYAPVLAACDVVLQSERGAFARFLEDSDRALMSQQRLFLISLLLLVALACALALLVYRGMIAPLREQLTESHQLIERQEKLAALGVLGAGVAHEIRNPLTAIKFRLFSLMESLPPGFGENEDARTIGEELDRLDRIVKDFLQFARPSEPDLKRVPAERILQEVTDFMRAELERATIELKLEVLGPVWVNADPHQLKQVLINLIQNAADSIGRKGMITVRLKRGHISVAGEVQPAAIITVADNGKGIPVEVQKRLFDPFFTTKEGGTGLGLAIAERIVEKHGGLLSYKTEVNRGTIFQIALPETRDHATENTAR